MSLEDADGYKNQGNIELKLNNYEKAVELYTKAIEINPTPIYYSNRAQANIKLENYGLAILDANESIKLDKNYLKAYYRRSVANFAILEYKNALNDIKLVLKIHKNDKHAILLEKEILKFINQIKFENAISIDENLSIINNLDFNSMIIEKNYTGELLDIQVENLELSKNDNKVGGKLIDKNNNQIVRINNLDLNFINKMIESFKKNENLPKKYVLAIISCANQIFLNESSLVEIEIDESKGEELITVVGDTHGQFYDVLNLFKLFGDCNKKHKYLFNGDFVDRGSWSCEVAILLYCLKILYPTQIFINRGNHETNDMNKVYGFEDECKSKYNFKIFQCFSESFNNLPYATLIGKNYLVMHGGLFSDDDITIEDIRKIPKNSFKQPPKEGIQMELLWTDPQVNEGRSPSKRGIGMQFGPDITKRFVEKNNLKAIIRSHEVRMNGYEIEHDGKLITVFSAPNYCDVQGNLGAVVNINLNDSKEYQLNFETFEAVEHPNIPPMAYTKNNMGY